MMNLKEDMNCDMADENPGEIVRAKKIPSKSKLNKTARKVLKNYQMYLMVLPGFILLILFAYGPMFGVLLAFKKYNIRYGIFGSPWVAFRNFATLFSNQDILKYMGNTVFYGVLNLVFVFPIPIIIALMMNELRIKWFKATFQTLSYLPFFLSWAVVGMMLYFFLNETTGTLNNLIEHFIGKSFNFYDMEAQHLWPLIITLVAIWKGTGWGTIMYLAALTSIPMELYEAAEIDGAGRWKQTVYITLAGIMPMVCLNFILNVPSLVRDNYEMIFALIGEKSFQLDKTTTVLGSYVYRLILSAETKSYGIGSAATLLQSVAAVLLMFGANKIVKKFGETGVF